MKKDCVRNVLSLHLSKIGYYVGCHPQWYIASFFLITVVLGTGFLKLSVVSNAEYLFSPSNGRGKLERKSLQSIFPVNLTKGFDLEKRITFGRGAVVLAVSNDSGYLKNNASITDLVELDRIIQNISIFWNNSFLRYKELRIKTSNHKYFGNFVTYLKKKLERIKYGKEYLRYPIERSNFDVKLHNVNFGGVLSNQTGYVEDFKAVRLFYLLDYRNEVRKRMTLMWEKAFVKILSNVKFPNIQFYILTSDDRTNVSSKISLLLIFISTILMVSFAIISCLSWDPVTSKPLIAIGGFLSSFFATAAAFGLLLYCNVEFIDMNKTAFFLLTAVGIDDSFVLLASWKRTNKEDSVEKRMSDTFSDAAVSVTITSLTNFLAFCLGLLSPYQAIRIFSAYTSLSILFDYIYQIFFFGGIMALDGYREKYNMHSFFLHTVQPTESSERKINGSESHNKKLKENSIPMFISENLVTLLGKKVVKISIIIIVFCSFIVSIINMKDIKQGLEFINIFPFSSHITKYLKAHYKYFTDYSHTVQVVFNQTLDYSNPIIQNDIENILKNFESTSYSTSSDYTICWLREYLSYINNYKINYLIKDLNINSTEGFLYGLKDIFLKFKLASTFKNDILWNEERDQILASRCFVTYGNIRNASDEKLFLEGVRQIAAESKYDVFVFNPWFIIYDQYLNMPMICLQSLSAAVLMIILVFVVITFDLSCIIFVALNAILILIQTIGYMSWWNVSLDLISVTILVISAGLCVDYSAHVAYAYKSCPQKESNEKIKASLHLAGYPVLQGCMTTILGLIVLYFGPSYNFVIFFKIVFLIILFAAFNGLILLPILLSIGDSFHTIFNKKNNE